MSPLKVVIVLNPKGQIALQMFAIDQLLTVVVQRESERESAQEVVQRHLISTAALG